MTKDVIYNFAKVGINPGTILTFLKDENRTCRVIDHKMIEFMGTTTSLSMAALFIVKEMGYTWTTISGPAYWQFEGETLVELRDRLNREEDI